MKKYTFIALFALLIGGISSSFIINPTTTAVSEKVVVSDELSWFTDFQKANAESKKTNKPIFAFFTGSDWCGWCRKLQADVFRKESFIKWAKEEVILLELDFPRRTALPEKLKKQNYELARLLKVKGYPTVWILSTNENPETKQVNLNLWGSTGYPSGATKGKEEVTFIANMEKIFATQKAK